MVASPGTANVVADLLLDVYEAYRDGDLDRARNVQLDKVLPLAQACMTGMFPAGFKAAARLTGYDLGVPRPPVHELDESELTTLCDVLTSLGIT